MRYMELLTHVPKCLCVKVHAAIGLIRHAVGNHTLDEFNDFGNVLTDPRQHIRGAAAQRVEVLKELLFKPGHHIRGVRESRVKESRENKKKHSQRIITGGIACTKVQCVSQAAHRAAWLRKMERSLMLSPCVVSRCSASTSPASASSAAASASGAAETASAVRSKFSSFFCSSLTASSRSSRCFAVMLCRDQSIPHHKQSF